MATKAQRTARKAQRAARRNRLTNVQVDEVSLVDSPAVPEAEFVIAKRLTEDELSSLEKTLADDQRDGDETLTAADIAKLVANATETEAQLEGTTTDGQIAKDGEPSSPATEETEPLEKAANATVGKAFVTAIVALRKVASLMNSGDLHQLASVMDHARWAFAEVPAVANELTKCEPLTDEQITEAAASSHIYKAVAELLKGEVLPGTEPTAEPTAEPTVEAPVAKTEPAEPVEPVTEPVVKAEPTVLEQVAKLYSERKVTSAQQKQANVEAKAMERLTSLSKQLEESAGRAGSLRERIDKATGLVS